MVCLLGRSGHCGDHGIDFSNQERKTWVGGNDKANSSAKAIKLTVIPEETTVFRKKKKLTHSEKSD